MTETIIQAPERGVVPRRSSILGGGQAGYPKNLNTGKPCRGASVSLPTTTAYPHGDGPTDRQTSPPTKARGGQVKKPTTPGSPSSEGSTS